ncbi:MAG: alanine--tRNA ligase [Candidatus Izemoplasmatales bacterium]|nr:alanine--tRNA ligase [Candidatus Izemoplasmatales bacterium]
MKALTGNEIRNLWLEFFKEKGHSVEAGASLIPNDDPTLLWMNAGVAALKKYFDGSVIPKNPRIVNVQKCIRTNDIEHVGKTARHHTFFEMLGNFSIGDYFRKEAVAWGFELLTDKRWFGFDKDKLYMTVYPTDQETRAMWIAEGIDPSHIVATEENNFWEIGEGPCGPCTEIFFDRGPQYGDYTVEAIRDDVENERFIEIWNIVFSQYNAKAGMKREEYPELPKKNIDTGCGLERIACVLQEVETNFETDLFLPIIRKIEAISGIDYQGQMAFKVIADHIRTVTFAIADGAVIANEGRGYVLRRLLRRAVKHGRKLGIEKPFMANLVDMVVKIMGDFYPQVKEQKEIVKRIVIQEESKFLETLVLGEKRFETIAKQSEGNVINGSDAFLLYDTFGFPIELTIEYAEEIGYQVDLPGFRKEMEQQRERARNARKDLQSMKSQNEEYLEFVDHSEFVGYDTLLIETRVLKVFSEGLVLEKTPFYATSGGQVADTGVIYNDRFSVKVTDVSKLPNGQYLHHFETLEGYPEAFELVIAKVDEIRRKQITAHHSATHLLFKALRDHLGSHVSQQGSQVGPDQLRFDFNHYEMPSDDILLQVEKQVREMIVEPFEATTEILSVDSAVQKGAIAEFGEKYDDLVRAVNLKYTLDLCGGTHVHDLSEIGKFAIRQVYSIGSGIYRIEALAGNAVDQMNECLKNTLDGIENIRVKISNLVEQARQEGIRLLPEYPMEAPLIGSYQDVINKRLEFFSFQQLAKEIDKEYQKLKQKATLSDWEKYLKDFDKGNLIAKVDATDYESLKQLADNLSASQSDSFVFLAAENNGKVLLVAKSKHPKIHAGELIKKAAIICEGNGGGRADFAQAGGKNPEKIPEALATIRSLIS